ncbi:MAG: flagellar protein FliS [Clostridiales bacterium]|jgi:flagellin-specific chaperone FliS|nr:flagellar protein FliS [Clostridiales bacterium]
MNKYLERLKKKYSRSVASASQSELVVISLELVLEFIKYGDLPRARQTVCQLAEALDFRYELSLNLYNMYAVIEKKLTAGIVANDVPAVNDAKYLIQLLLERWKDTARAEPTSASAPHDSPKIYTGLTYGPAGLCEYAEQDYSGGFKA